MNKFVDNPLKILLLNQCFYPDHVSTSQHLTDLALGLAERGHDVTVIASSRGYDDASVRYPVNEIWNHIRIKRIWVPGLGKKSKWRRFVDFGIFWLNACRLLTFLPRFDVTVCLTSPPLISFAGALAAAVKGGAVLPWVMDLNPDEAVAAGWLRQGSLAEKVLSALQTWSFQRARSIVAMDRFMKDRIAAKGVPPDIIHAEAPWSHDDVVRYSPEGRARFRAAHGLEGKFVVMYSGNHSPCHPLDPLLRAALEFKDQNIAFAFIGGGSELPKVKAFAEKHKLANVLTLPYQPLNDLSASLSSADLHAVVVGQPFVGIVHPCKIYNILSLGLPVVGIGPAECHLADLTRRLNEPTYANMAQPDDPGRLHDILHTAMTRGPLPPSPLLQELGAEFSKRARMPKLIQLIEAVRQEQASESSY